MAERYADDSLDSEMVESTSSSMYRMSVDDTVRSSRPISTASNFSTIVDVCRLDDTIICNPCHLDDKSSVTAVVYCIECDEHMCSNCRNTHRNFKLSRDHHVIVHGTQPSATSTETCTEHPGNSIIYLCDNHQALCCRSCLNVDHKQCITIRNIFEESKGIKASTDLKDCENALRSLSTRFDEIKIFKHKQNIEINQQKSENLKKISHLRTKVNELFDQLEESANDELRRESNELIEENEVDIETYEDICVKLKASLDRLGAVSRSAGDAQIFVTMQRALSQARRFEQVVNEVEHNLKEVTLTFKENKVLTEWMTKLTSMGTVNIDTRCRYTSTTNLVRSRSSHLVMRKRAIPAGGHSVRIHSDKTTCNVTGCFFLKDDRLVIADYNNKCIKLFDNKCLPKCHLDLSSRPYGVSALTDCEIVTSLADERVIQLCHVDQVIKLGSRFPTREKYVALVCSSRKEIYAACCFELTGGQVHVLNKKGELLRTIGEINMEFPTFIRPVSLSLSDDNSLLFVSDLGRNCVVCIDITLSASNNKVVFKYTDSNLDLREGLTIDESGSLYVASGNGTVHQVSYMGLKVNEILTKNDGVDVPHSMCFSNKHQTLVLIEYRENKMKMFALI